MKDQIKKFGKNKVRRPPTRCAERVRQEVENRGIQSGEIAFIAQDRSLRYNSIKSVCSQNIVHYVNDDSIIEMHKVNVRSQLVN